MRGIALPELTDPDLIGYTEKAELRTKQTYTSYCRNLQQYLNQNNLTLQHITPLQCRRFIQIMGNYHDGTYESMNTAFAYKRFTRALMEGIDRKAISKWLKANLKEVQHQNHFSVDIAAESIMRLIDVTPDYHADLRFAWSIMAFDGLRPGEALGAYHTDIDQTNKVIQLQRHSGEKYFPKGTKTTDPPVSLPLNDLSLALYHKIPFDQKQSNRIVNTSYKTMRKWFNRYVKQANLIDQNGHKVTLHKLRHFFGHFFSDKSNNTQVLQAIMRHSSLIYTQIYTKPSKRKVTEEFEATVNSEFKT